MAEAIDNGNGRAESWAKVRLGARNGHPLRGVMGVCTDYHRMAFKLTTLNMDLIAFEGLPILHDMSANWGFSISKLIKRTLNLDYPTLVKRPEELEYILFIDGDSCFSMSDLAALRTIMDSDESIDAVFPVQPKRSGGMPINFNFHPWIGDKKPVSYDYSGPTTEVVYGHFGFTLVRPRVFKEMPKPWFMAVPDEDGEWDSNGSIDFDHYFWRKLGEMHQTNGRKTVQANRVGIGHQELMVMFQRGMEVVYMPVTEFWRTGVKPDDLRCPTVEEMLTMGLIQVPEGNAATT